MNKEDEGYQEKMKYVWRNSSHAILNTIISQSNNSSETSSPNTKTCQSLIKMQKSLCYKASPPPSAKSGTQEGEKSNGSSKNVCQAAKHSKEHRTLVLTLAMAMSKAPHFSLW